MGFDLGSVAELGANLGTAGMYGLATGKGYFGTGIGATGRSTSDQYGNNMAGARAEMGQNYTQAQKDLTSGYGQASTAAKNGFQKAINDTSAGYDAAKGTYNTQMGAATDAAKSGYNEAQGQYDTAPMVASRQELYQRVLGNGGYSPTDLANMKASTTEAYGSGLRNAEQGLNQFYGDSTGSGMAGENLARAAASLGATKANSLRDIDVGNAQLKRQEQTGAMTSLSAEAAQRAGLSAQEAQTVSGMAEKLAEGGANLSTEETNALSQLAAQKGTTLSGLQSQLATSKAGLTAEEAKALAEMEGAQFTGQATMNSQKGLLSSIFS